MNSAFLCHSSLIISDIRYILLKSCFSIVFSCFAIVLFHLLDSLTTAILAADETASRASRFHPEGVWLMGISTSTGRPLDTLLLAMAFNLIAMASAISGS